MTTLIKRMTRWFYPQYHTVTVWRVTIYMKSGTTWNSKVSDEQEMEKLFAVISDCMGKRMTFTLNDLSIWMADVNAIHKTPYTRRERVL